MSHLPDGIRNRRSVRKYEDHRVPKEIILELLEAAGWAPSAHNAQPWRFIVLDDGQAKTRLAKDMAKAWAADMAKDGIAVEPEMFRLRIERFAEAPALVLACMSMEGMTKQPDTERQGVERDLAMQSLGAALENLLLAAHTLGLGACWFCAPAYCREAVRAALKIPEKVEPQALIALGYPAEKSVAPARKRVGEYCFLNQWGAPLKAQRNKKSS
jgi:F420 biosynthesis protein FbiB-like protein